MTVTLLYTGGTIGGKVGTGPMRKDHATDAFGRILRPRLPAGLQPDEIEGLIGKLSENLGPAHWSVLARKVDACVRSGSTGLVVAHGTDTLIYSACALRWLLRGIPVPVVVTGSRLPLEEAGTDAVENVVQALRLARNGRPGVWIAFSGKPGTSGLILDPLNARKDASRPDCFQPVRGRPAGRIVASSGRLSWFTSTGPAEMYSPRFEVEGKAALFTLHPGFRPDWILQAVRGGMKDVVLAGYGSGTACAEGEFDLRPAVREAVSKGMNVWMVSQHGGRVEPAYGSTAGLVKAGLTLAPGFTPEAALTALLCGRPLKS